MIRFAFTKTFSFQNSESGEIIFNNEMNNLDPGYYKQIWDASNQSTGIYFCKILIEGKVQDIIKMVLVK